MSQSWNAPQRQITPESALRSRRRLLKYLGFGALGVAGAAGWWWWSGGGSDVDVLTAGQVTVPTDGRYTALRHEDFTDAGRALTDEAATARYCNFYEFSTGKQVWRYVEPFNPVPWKLEVSGLVARPQTFDLDDLANSFPLEERIYRHRCVEAWAMVVPWTGFPLNALVRRAEPLVSARYVRFVTFNKPVEAPRQRDRSYPWPYTEGLTIEEAANELAFMAIGMYGHPLLKQHGAPVRLVVPWKYGFKSAKSVVRIEFTDQKPATFWNTVAPTEYDFTANVNPDVPHPRWSQKRERMLGTGEVYPTERYNGYGEWVASLYG